MRTKASPTPMPRIVAAVLLIAGASVAFAGCDNKAAPPADDNRYPLNADTRALMAAAKDPLTPKAAMAIQDALVNAFGIPSSPNSGGAPFLDTAKLIRGRGHYVRNCAHCHGYFGGADGPTAPFLNPRPRDFSRKGFVKFKSSNADYPHIKEDLERTVHQGIAGTSMPAFGYPYGPPSMHVDDGNRTVPDAGVEDVSQYVALLMMRARLEELLVVTWQNDGDADLGAAGKEKTAEIIDDWKKAQDPANRLQPTSPRPNYDEAGRKAAIAEGRKLFLSEKAKCATCHGDQARGDGSSMFEKGVPVKDDWGNELQARDLTRGIYRGGRRPIDLYRRIRHGIKGTTMPSFGDSILKDSDVWALVEYVRSIPLESQPQAKP